MYPYAFVWRRLHSILGVFLVVYLSEHLFTNVKSVFDPEGFVRSVNWIHSFSYLRLIEILLIALPFFFHMVWGLLILKTSLPNSGSSDGTTPSLREYPKNHAYTWQRITSWILLVAIVVHVIHMRFLNYPAEGTDFGEATLLVLKETFSNSWFCLFYTAFVLAATFHGFNGLFTAMITWGITLTERSQTIFRRVAYFLMALVSFFGLATIWYR